MPPMSATGFSSLFQPIRLCWNHRRLLGAAILSEMRGMYAGSVLGLVWVALGPIILLSIYTAIYTLVFKVQPVGMTLEDYVLHVFAGLIPFIAFCGALTVGALSISSNRQLLLNTVFPSELIPIRSVLSASTVLPVGLLLLMVFQLLRGDGTWFMALVPVVILLQMMFLVGVSWVLSLLGLLLKDLGPLLNYVSLLLLIVTPIAYTPDMMPGYLRILIYVNPLYYFVNAYQQLIVQGVLPSHGDCMVTLLLGVGAFALGHGVFRRGKDVFYDFA